MRLKRAYDDCAQSYAFRCLRTLLFLLFSSALITAQLRGQTDAQRKLVQYDGANWHLKGEGMVCCPCKVPCPCRNNGQPSYGHCEATLYLKIREGNYGSVDLSGMQVVDSGGMCAISYHRLAALYFDRSSSPAQRSSYMKLIASFDPDQKAEFLHVQIVPINTQIVGDHLFTIGIPGILEMSADRNWGGPTAPMQQVAAPDNFSNEIQYAQNIRYLIHDSAANINFDYSHRQANWRSVDLSVQQYRSKSMLIQFVDGTGWFNPQQMALIQMHKLKLPQVEAIRQEALRLQETTKH